jgi:hypothetical protein
MPKGEKCQGARELTQAGIPEGGAYDVISCRQPIGTLRVREDRNVLGPITKPL